MVRILTFDTETTGLSTTKDRICQLGLTLMEEDGSELLRYETLIDPQMKIPAKTSDIHGIMDADVLGKPTWHEIGPRFKRIIAKADIIAGHNIKGYDMPMVVSECIRCGVDIVGMGDGVQVLDTTEWRWATPNGKIPRLGELCFSLGIDYDEEAAHSAMYDVEVNARCIIEAMRRGLYRAGNA